jgi:hypothetical protein
METTATTEPKTLSAVVVVKAVELKQKTAELIAEGTGERYVVPRSEDSMLDPVRSGQTWVVDYEITAKGNKKILRLAPGASDEPARAEEREPIDVQVPPPEASLGDDEPTVEFLQRRFPGTAWLSDGSQPSPNEVRQIKLTLITHAWDLMKTGFTIDEDTAYKVALEKFAKPAYRAITGQEWT